MICHILIVHVLSHYIVNSKGCRCVPARRRYFSGKMSLKVRADAAIWAVYADYSYYVKKNFPAFTRGHPRLSSRFADTIDQTYDACSYMADEDSQDAIADAVDEFLGITSEADIF